MKSEFDVEKFASELHLEIILPGKTGKMNISVAETTRPGLQFAGYFDYFGYDKVQIVGMPETMFLAQKSNEYRKEVFQKFFSYDVPCVIMARDMTPHREMMEFALKRGVPLFRSKQSTTMMIQVVNNYLSNALAPEINRHGVLMDIYGVGIMLKGESGIGKSETALELIKRKHRLVADDVVKIRRVSPTRLEGSSPTSTRYLLEIRGIGILDVSKMYGVSSVIREKKIDLVIELEMWKESKQYERLGLTHERINFLDVDVPYMLIPVRPGRNLAIVIEAAARYFILKQQGINPAKELEERLSLLEG